MIYYFSSIRLANSKFDGAGWNRMGKSHPHACWWEHKLMQVLFWRIWLHLLRWKVLVTCSVGTDFCFRSAWVKTGPASQGPQGHLSSATCQDPTTTLNYHRHWRPPLTPYQPQALCLLHLLSISYTLTGMTWLRRTLPNVSFSNPIKRRNTLGNQRHCRTHKVSNLLSEQQETAHGKRKGTECRDMRITLKQEYDLVIMELAQTGCWCKWLPLCDFSEPHYLMSRCNPSKDGVTIELISPPQNQFPQEAQNQFPQEAGPGVWHGGVFFWQANLGGLVTGRTKPQAGFPMLHMCPWATFNFSVQGTKTSKFSLYFSTVPSINEFCTPSPKRY